MKIMQVRLAKGLSHSLCYCHNPFIKENIAVIVNLCQRAVTRIYKYNGCRYSSGMEFINDEVRFSITSYNISQQRLHVSAFMKKTGFIASVFISYDLNPLAFHLFRRGFPFTS